MWFVKEINSAECNKTRQSRPTFVLGKYERTITSRIEAIDVKVLIDSQIQLALFVLTVRLCVKARLSKHRKKAVTVLLGHEILYETPRLTVC